MIFDLQFNDEIGFRMYKWIWIFQSKVFEIFASTNLINLNPAWAVNLFLTVFKKLVFKVCLVYGF